MNDQVITQSSHRTSRRLSLVGCAAIGLLAMSGAHAQWQVIDNDANRTLEEISKRIGDGNVNENLEKIFEQQKIGSHQSAGDEAKAPELLLDESKPMGTTMTDIGVDKRCPSSAKASGVALQQAQLCKLIVETELAQYKYSLKMYQTAKDRYQRLKAIQDERSNIGEDEQGKLQGNNNKLLALLSLLQIDRQQQRTYMDAYAVRLDYLRAARDTLTKQALKGDPGLALASGVIGGAVLKSALELAKTESRYNR